MTSVRPYPNPSREPRRDARPAALLGSGARKMPALACLGLAWLGLPGCERVVETHWDSGVLRSRGRVDRLDGQREGEWIFHYPNGERRESGRYADGRRVGVWTQWYPNGQLRSLGARQASADGVAWREGPWTYWHENGIVAARGIHLHGQREGYWDMSIDTGGLDGLASGLYQGGVRLDAPSDAGDRPEASSTDAGSSDDDVDSSQDGKR